MKAENNKKLKEKKNWILLLLKKLAKILFNRIFYVAVAMLVQLGWIFLMVLRLAAFSRYVDIVIKLVGVVLVLWILNKEINPSYKLAWTMLILILPILGVVLYFVFGRSRIATIMQQHFEQRIEESREYLRDGRRQGRSWKSWIRQQRSSPDIFRMFPDFRFMRIRPRNISR